MIRRVAMLAAVILAMGASSDRALACATCFGASDAPMARGMNMGIFTMLLVIGFVLAGIAACFATLAVRTTRRARSTPGEADPEPFNRTEPAAGWAGDAVWRR